MEYKRYKRKARHLASIPFIYLLLIPMIIFDFFLELYHRICFPLYGLTLIPRHHYIIIDRHLLPYLSYVEKMNCMYCGYANGLANYFQAIAQATEQYWCGIKHKVKTILLPENEQKYLAYGDEEAFCKLIGKHK